MCGLSLYVSLFGVLFLFLPVCSCFPGSCRRDDSILSFKPHIITCISTLQSSAVTHITVDQSTPQPLAE